MKVLRKLKCLLLRLLERFKPGPIFCGARARKAIGVGNGLVGDAAAKDADYSLAIKGSVPAKLCLRCKSIADFQGAIEAIRKVPSEIVFSIMSFDEFFDRFEILLLSHDHQIVVIAVGNYFKASVFCSRVFE